jgi:putative nucleotidyltransferase with HDIG domain
MIAAELAALACLCVAGTLLAGLPGWDPALFSALLAFAIAGDLFPVELRFRLGLSSSFLAIVVAMVLLGPGPAMLIGIATTIADWARTRYPAAHLPANLVNFALFPLVGGVVFAAVSASAGLGPDDAFFYLLLFGVYQLALALNVGMNLAYTRVVHKVSLRAGASELVVPLLPSELPTALMTVGIALLYHQIGIAAIALFAVVLVTFQHLLGRLVLSERRAEQLAEQGEQLRFRTTQLASLQVGVLTALMRTLDLRDRMTARHCAAVARYSREVAIAAGLSDAEIELVHTAGLLHDIGKFIFPDRILKGDTKLTDEEWQIVKMHPYQGARIVSSVDGYGPVGEVILAHHERIDGKGYPRGLRGDQIPILSRIISVADTYDVLTARDSYREPVSSFEAIQELRRVAGAQLDAELVEVFVEMLAGRDMKFRHGECADFDAELSLDRRIRDYSQAVPATAAELPDTAGRGGSPAGNASADRKRAPAPA